MESFEVRSAELGENEAEVVDVHVHVGDRVRGDQVIAAVETGKVTQEVYASKSGVVRALPVKVGDKVVSNTVFAVLEVEPPNTPPGPVTEPAASPPSPKPSPAPSPAPPHPSLPPPAEQLAAPELVHAGPAVRRLAREWGVNLSLVSGSGRKQRVMAQDVKGFVRDALVSPTPRPQTATGAAANNSINFDQFGETERRPLSALRRTSARRVSESAATIPHVTHFDSADITDLEQFRVQLNSRAQGKFTLLPFLLKAVAATLLAFPEFNASLIEDQLVLKRFVNLGFAVDTPEGLFVPVIRNVDKLSITELSRAVFGLVTKATNKKLTADDVKGGGFTITSLGSISTRAFTPIINAPEVAILGVSRHGIEPRWDGHQFQPRLMLPLSLSFDHRAIDGAAAARFLKHLTELLADLRRVLL